jgi:hypothetical protein
MRKALAKNPADRYETCVEFVNALASACHSLPGWTPLPRGAGMNMPTVGSQEGLAETIADPLPQQALPPPALPQQAPPPKAPPLPTPAPPPIPPPPIPVAAPVAQREAPAPVIAPVVAAAVTPPVVTPPIAPLKDPRERHKGADASHIFRNVIFSAGATALVCMALLVWAGKLGGHRTIPPDVTTTNPVPEVAPAPDPTPTPVPPPPAADQPVAQQTPPVTEPAPDPVPVTKPQPVAKIPVALPAAPTEATFQLTATPAGATAVFDKNEMQCTVPCTVTLTAGRHTLLVRSAGYRDASRIIEIPRDPGLIVNLERMIGTLSLITNPAGLTVIIDGQEQSRKTPATFSLVPGPHRVEVVRGTERHALAVEIHDGSTIERSVDWSQ